MAGPPPGWTPVTSSGPPAGWTPVESAPGPPAGWTPVDNNAAYSPAPQFGDKLNAIIDRNAKQYKVDPALIRAIIGRESDGNPGAVSSVGASGLMQLMPNTFAEQGVGDNSKDPAQSVAAGTKYLASLLAKYKGDTRKALAAYNSGPGNVDKYGGIPPFKETQDYVRNVYGDYESYQASLRPVEANPLPVDTKKVKDAAKLYNRGLSPGQIAAKEVPHAKDIEKFKAALSFARSHPFVALSTLERSVGGFLEAREKDQNLNQSIETIKQFAFHPTDTIRARATNAERIALNIPSNSVIDENIDHYVPGPLRKHAKILINGSADFVAQNVFDPMNILPVGKVVDGAGFGAKMLYHAAEKAGLGKVFAHLAPEGSSISKIGQDVYDSFAVRPELDKFFSKADKSRRLSIENSAAGEAARWKTEDDKLINDGKEASKRFLDHYAPILKSGISSVEKTVGDVFGIRGKELSEWMNHYKTLTPEAQKLTRDELQNQATFARARRIAAMSPTEREKELASIRQKIAEQNVLERSKKTLTLIPGATITDSKGASRAATMSDIAMQPEARTFLNPAVSRLAKVPQMLSRKMVQLMPFPHALYNVGTLAYLAGGPEALMRGVWHMAVGLSKNNVERLQRIGAEASYTHGVEDLTKSSIPGLKQVGQVEKPVTTALNAMATRIEMGWRQALLDQLDRKMGKSMSDADELLKGHLVTDAVGDYRNQSAFVHTFGAIGGPFVAFGLGIGPKNVGKTVLKHPNRVENVLRAQEDIQNNRPDKRVNQFDVGGSVGDIETLLKNPAKYITSPSRLGIIGNIVQAAQNSHPTGIVDGLLNGFIAANPELGLIGEFTDIAAGRGQPTVGAKGAPTYMPHQTFQDKLVEMLQRALTSSRYSRPETKSQQSKEARDPYRSL